MAPRAIRIEGNRPVEVSQRFIVTLSQSLELTAPSDGPFVLGFQFDSTVEVSQSLIEAPRLFVRPAPLR